MPCSITLSINQDGKLITKVKWGDDESKTNIRKFRKVLQNLQKGHYNIEICEAIINFSNENADRETGKQLLKVLAEKDNFNGPVIYPHEMGEEI